MNDLTTDKSAIDVVTVFNLLCSDEFQDWFEIDFTDFRTGCDPAPTKVEIFQWLNRKLVKD